MLKSQRRIGYLLIAPALTVVVLLSVYPILYQFWLSLTDWYILRNPEPVFQGLKGYQRFFQDPMVWSSLGRTVIWTVGTVLIEFAVGLPLALLLNRRSRLNAVLSGLILLPWVTPSIVVAYAWRWLLDGQYGTVHYLLHTVGLVGERSLLGNPSIALYVVTVISAWKGIPFMAVALLAALKAIPFDLYEAAAVDGASAWQRFLHVTLPLLRNTAVVISLLLGILAFYSFDLVWIITDKGGPLNATTLIGVYLFRSFFERKDFSYAAVIGMMMLLILIVTSAVYLRALRRAD
ncbi:MAG: sugar ABC transporter permease [Caldilineaceae bacterium]